MSSFENRYRLRIDQDIVGYMRKVSNRMIMYSKDSFWWNGRKLLYQDVDEWTGFKDKNNRYIYEWDILKYKIDPDGPYLEGVILWEANSEEFGIRNIKDGSFIPLTVDEIKMFNERQLIVFSFLFVNPDLKKKLGVKD